MTCIVAVTDGKTVTIGGDSAGANAWEIHTRSDSKVFEIGPYVMGFTTSFRMGQLLRYSLNVGAPDTWDVDRFMATTFIDAVRTCLKTGGWAATNSNGREEGGTFIVGIHGRIYCVEDDYQIGYTAKPYAAVGSGWLAALGALHALDDSALSPEDRVTRALEAAADLTPSVRGPYTLVSSGV